MFHFLTHWKRQKTVGFLTFSEGGTEMPTTDCLLTIINYILRDCKLFFARKSKIVSCFNIYETSFLTCLNLSQQHMSLKTFHIASSLSNIYYAE